MRIFAIKLVLLLIFGLAIFYVPYSQAQEQVSTGTLDDTLPTNVGAKSDLKTLDKENKKDNNEKLSNKKKGKKGKFKQNDKKKKDEKLVIKNEVKELKDVGAKSKNALKNTKDFKKITKEQEALDKKKIIEEKKKLLQEQKKAALEKIKMGKKAKADKKKAAEEKKRNKLKEKKEKMLLRERKKQEDMARKEMAKLEKEKRQREKIIEKMKNKRELLLVRKYGKNKEKKGDLKNHEDKAYKKMDKLEDVPSSKSLVVVGSPNLNKTDGSLDKNFLDSFFKITDSANKYSKSLGISEADVDNIDNINIIKKSQIIKYEQKDGLDSVLDSSDKNVNLIDKSQLDSVNNNDSDLNGDGAQEDVENKNNLVIDTTTNNSELSDNVSKGTLDLQNGLFDLSDLDSTLASEKPNDESILELEKQELPDQKVDSTVKVGDGLANSSLEKPKFEKKIKQTNKSVIKNTKSEGKTESKLAKTSENQKNNKKKKYLATKGNKKLAGKKNSTPPVIKYHKTHEEVLASINAKKEKSRDKYKAVIRANSSVYYSDASSLLTFAGQVALANLSRFLEDNPGTKLMVELSAVKNYKKVLTKKVISERVDIIRTAILSSAIGFLERDRVIVFTKVNQNIPFNPTGVRLRFSIIYE